MENIKERFDVIEGDLYNHGQDGLKSQFMKFVTEFRTTEKNRKEALEAQQQQVKDTLAAKDRVDSLRDKRIMRWFQAAIVVLTAVLALVGYIALRDPKKNADNNPPAVRHSAVQSPQDASDPTIR